MKALKNIAVGFLVSFVGSIPLGYLNVIGFQVYEKSGYESLIYYLLGVVFVEAFVIYGTLIFAQKLSENKKLIKYIEIFSILFMLLLAYIFWSQSRGDSDTENYLERYIGYSSFAIGIIFNSLNFAQIPFWVGWNLYVVNNKYVFTGKKLSLVYLVGTLLGSCGGIFAVVMLLSFVSDKYDSLSKYLMSHIIPLFFLSMAVYQTYKFYKKYNAAARVKK